VLLLAGCGESTSDWERGKGESAPGQADGAPGTVAAAEAPLPLLDQRARPATVGMDSVLLHAAVERAGGQYRLHNMIVARHGEVVVERHFRGPPPHRPANVKSVSKSLLSGIVGLAIRDGYMDGVEIPIGPFFPEYLPNDPETTADGDGAERRPLDPRSRITVGHLLSMSSGLESTSFRNYGSWVASSNWVRAALERPVLFEPGERMLYSTGNSHLVSALLTRAVGRSTHAYARHALAEPLGIQLPPWPTDPQGIYFGGNDMLISPRGLLRFGELYRQGGEMDGEMVLPREWIEESWRIRVRSRRDGSGYGLGWWAREAGGHQVRFAWGYGGQFLFVVPALELTVVFTSDPWTARERGHNQVLHRLVDDYLVPAAELGSRAEPVGHAGPPEDAGAGGGPAGATVQGVGAARWEQ
jgi:CubicO group peptidase (beta-lactamase class C family)